MILRFAGFDLDSHRSELRPVGGEAIKLRPKTFALLQLLATNANRLISKQEMMAAVWPNIHVGDDSLFQCIREIRTALGDEDRRLVKSVSGRGYLLDVEVRTITPEKIVLPEAPPAATQPADTLPPVEQAPEKKWLGLARRPFLAGLLTCCVVGAAIAGPILVRRLTIPSIGTIAIIPIEARSADAESLAMAANITDGLTDGLSQISNIKVLASQSAPSSLQAAAYTPSTQPDFILRGDLQRNPGKWDIQARLIEGKSGQVKWSGTYSVTTNNVDRMLQQTRLIARIGYPLALRINALAHARLPSTDSKIVIEEASTYINRTTRDRFAAAQTMLENALAAHPNDVDLKAALAAHLLRGIQVVWYPPAEAERAEHRARSLLESVLKSEPNYIPGLQAYCRFLITTNYFTESLVACRKALSFEPWDGSMLFHLGIAQLQLGLFDDALDTFERADAYDTPPVSRWTWLLGEGFTLVVLQRYEEALDWLQRSLAVTPGTGRTHMVLAAAYEALGRHEEAKAAVAEGMKLRPGATVENVNLPPKNESARYLAARARIDKLLIAAGLPER